ncbi:VOC family protein [Elizabethkingia anophelis]|uniref:VOC family protein n=1 Tax=Elizabethkingia anophelis TaxID=1117645 RepID=UPI0004E46BDB|nr:VOC family protein [Elizabethkingia anophelis]KFC35841.1 glyoxalase [Elizabethkingia anophelis]MCT3787617.1 VOC family protein [Elizabethkingia anophelis]MDV3501332.1 VOC family virulence protein [Elizabethkingia anophelis]PKR32561.1 VOC family virulence protein [Elizabethkingia anophelis]PKR34215.1 VOC family virulence protein [Elizabethkingia anophelis]
MRITSIDHIVLTVADIEKTVQFYTEVLGFELVTFGDNRKALRFGNQKINLHQKGHEFEPKALYPTSSSADICFITETNVEDILKELRAKNIQITEGIVERTGALGKIHSVYLRDPDSKLIELSNYLR